MNSFGEHIRIVALQEAVKLATDGTGLRSFTPSAFSVIKDAAEFERWILNGSESNKDLYDENAKVGNISYEDAKAGVSSGTLTSASDGIRESQYTPPVRDKIVGQEAARRSIRETKARDREWLFT